MELTINHEKKYNKEKAETKCVIDKAEFEAIYNNYHKRVFNYISYRLNDHHMVEELVSEVFERVIKKYHTFDPSKSVFEAWIIGIAKNCIADYFRAAKKNKVIPLDHFEDSISGSRAPEEIIVKNEDNYLLIKALSTLKERERNLIAMKYAAELKNAEIAQVLGISESNVKVILFRTQKKLRRILEQEK